jgi:undecaprenyl diphosphate synthase
MDGNGRWAAKRGRPRKFGHRAGVKVLNDVAKYLFSLGVEYVTVYAFSTENVNRPPDEVEELISLIRRYFKTTFREFIALGIHVRAMGDETYFPPDVVDIIKKLDADSRGRSRGVLNIALNYGGRDEIVRAANLAAAGGGPIDRAAVEARLYTAGMPDPDLIVRTGGEKRLSNFLLYQAAYAELFFTDTLWPDFSRADVDAILGEFSRRERRFGRI